MSRLHLFLSHYQRYIFPYNIFGWEEWEYKWLEDDNTYSTYIHIYSYTIENFALTDRGIRQAVTYEGREPRLRTEIEVGQPKYNNLTWERFRDAQLFAILNQTKNGTSGGAAPGTYLST